MKKSTIVLFFSALLSTGAFAQSVQDGVNHLYAERFQSAKGVFEGLASNPKTSDEANYWLGQTLLKMKDSAAAVAHYQKAVAANSNAPFTLVGLGQVEIMQGKAAEAKQHFETALNLSRHKKKGDNPNVLVAIGRANVDAKPGDLAYALEKLKQAVQLDPNNAEAYFTLGNAYRKAHEGGQAVTNYTRATQLNPAFGAAFYRIAKLYQTQQAYSEVVLDNLNKAVAADAKFAPAYLDLYYYYLLYPKDFAKAQEFANKYVSNADPSVENEYLKAQTSFVQKNYDEAITIGKKIVDQAGDKVNPRVLRMLTYAHLEKGDTAGAKPYVDQFFTKSDVDDRVPADYTMKADVYGKDDPNAVMAAYMEGAMQDTALDKQVKFLNEGIDRFTKAGNKVAAADLRLLSYHLRQTKGGSTHPTELVSYMAVPYYQGGAYLKADSVSKMYIAAAPDSIYGHLWGSRALARIDTSMEQGLAVESYKALLNVAANDKERFKSYGVEAAGYLAGYYNNVKKEKDTAIAYLERALEFDPANTAITSTIAQLKKPAPAPKSAAQKPRTGTKPK